MDFMIIDILKKESKSLRERGIYTNSFFHVIFEDGSEAKEYEYNWSAMSEEVAIKHMGKMKMTMLSIHPIKKINISCGLLSTSLNIEKGDRVYQAIRSTLSLDGSGNQVSKNIGRIVGIVRNGVMIEEQFLNTEANQIYGIRN
jgi:hypothetical protein